MKNKRQNNKQKVNVKEMFALDFKRVSHALNIMPVLHISGQGQVEAEHCKGIEEYTSTSIILKLGQINAQITGNNLTLETLTKHKIYIKGTLFSVNFIYNSSGEHSENI